MKKKKNIPGMQNNRMLFKVPISLRVEFASQAGTSGYLADLY